MQAHTHTEPSTRSADHTRSHAPLVERHGASGELLADQRPAALAHETLRDAAQGSARVQQLRSLAQTANAHSAAPVQMVERDASVTWAITHLVRKLGSESLFGSGNGMANEVPPEALGQLSYGQKLIVDDEAVFMSRRGANQEDKERRRKDAEDDELRNKWYKVLAVFDGETMRAMAADTYVRAETIALHMGPKPSAKRLGVMEHRSDDERVTKGLEGMHGAWRRAELKRGRSIGRVGKEEDFIGKKTPSGDEVTSGWNWDQFDEGVNVSRDMANPEERKPFAEVKSQVTLSASYTDEDEPIAYMVLEVRQYDDDPPFMYIRWLIGHPEKGGGGSELIAQAIKQFQSSTCSELRVDSAFSAVNWYVSKGFKPETEDFNPVAKGVGYADTSLVMRK